MPTVAFAHGVFQEMFTANNSWMLVATFEGGPTRAENTVNLLFKNTAIVGFNLLYPVDFSVGQFF